MDLYETNCVAFRMGTHMENGVSPKFHIAMAHSDYPCFQIKPQPDIASGNVMKLNVDIYSITSDFNIFSFDGISKTFITISLFNLIFSYSLRYIMIKLFCLLTPFALLTLLNNSTSWFSNS